jgi:tetratricopeptide (TPR) repeat protein
MRTLGDRKLLLVITQPPNGVLPFDEKLVRRLHMPPMQLEEVRRFAAELLGVEEIPKILEELVFESSGGNALFVKEIVGQLRRQGLVQIQDGEVVLKGNIEDAGIPASVEDLIASRINSLTAGERVVLEVAATIGRSFERRLLRETTQLDAERLTECLARLQALKLVRPMRADEQAADADYTFRNNMCWEVATRGILAGRAKEFHVHIGEALERLHEDQLQPHHESLSRHYQAGGLLRRAARFAEQAGIAYDRDYFNREALRCFQRAILLLRGAEAKEGEARETAAHLAELYLRIGDIRGRDAAHKESERNYAKALDFAGEADDERLETKALIKLGHARVELGKLDAAGSFLARAQEMAELMGDEELRTDADEEVAGWALKKGDFAAARRALTRALDTAKANDDKLRVARILGSLGSYYMRAGQYDLSERHLEQAREIAMETDDKVLQSKLLNNLGVTYIHVEKFREALACYREACEIRQAIEYRRGVIVNLHNIGDVYFRMGDYARAFQYFEESLAAADTNDWELGRAMNLVYLGYLQALRGEIEEGEEALTSGITRAQSVGDKEIASQGKVFLARVFTRRGEVLKARELLADADGMIPLPSTKTAPPASA